MDRRGITDSGSHDVIHPAGRLLPPLIPPSHPAGPPAASGAALGLVQEKGWDVGQTIEKLLQNGARLSAEAHEIVRIPGLLTDADMIGECPEVALGCCTGTRKPWWAC
jgi:hypothetical protein